MRAPTPWPVEHAPDPSTTPETPRWPWDAALGHDAGAAHAEVVSSPAGLVSLSPMWRDSALAQRNMFLTPEWFFASCNQYRETPWVVVVRDGAGTVVGLLPLIKARRGTAFAGAGFGDVFGPACRPGDEDAVMAAAAEVVDWARPVVLKNVTARGRADVLAANAPTAVATTALRHDVLPFLDLPSTWDEYLSTQSRNFRGQMRRKERHLVGEHGAQYRLTEREDQLEADLDTFFRLHEARWDARAGQSAIVDQRTRAFHHRFARSALRAGWLRLWFMEVDGVAVAASYGWLLRDRFCYFQAGFEPAWARTSVGFVLLAHTVRSAIEEGATAYDFLLGDDAYKRRFAAEDRAVRTLVLTRRRSVARALATGESLAWRTAAKLGPTTRESVRLVVGRFARNLHGSQR